jgi:heme A synthase
LLHASLAALAFSILIAIAVLSSSLWAETPELVDGHATPLLRPLAIAAPPLVLLQIVLGAAYRHKLTGVIPHLGGAMIVSIATLVAAMQVKQHYPGHRAMRVAATWLIAVVLAQVILGATAFAMQLLGLGNAIALIIATASHVVVGSLTLAAALVLAMQVQRNVPRGKRRLIAQPSRERDL